MQEDLKRRLQVYNPAQPRVGAGRGEAAVLVPVTRGPEPNLIFTLRSMSLATHRGEVSFPGGHREPQDIDLVHTALRETEEEVGLPASKVEVLGRLGTLLSLHDVRVTPYVGLVPEAFDYRVDRVETAEVFSVPLEFFRQQPERVTHRSDFTGRDWYITCYRFQEYKIWGLTAIMVVELVNLLFDAGISLHDQPDDSVIVSRRPDDL